jgi:hypothetical protein
VKKLIVALFIFISLSAFATENYINSQLNLTASIGPVFSVTMDDPETFGVVGSDHLLIPSKEIGNTIIKSNYSSWKISVDSVNKTSSTVGGLKLDGAETYIPYTFALMDSSTLLVSNFSTKSIGQPITTYEGKALTLYLYFDHSDETSWPRGIYRDTLILSITTD